MMKQKVLCLLLTALLLCSLSACAGLGGSPAATDSPAPGAETEAPSAGGAEITLNGDGIRTDAKGVAVSGSTVTIATPGEYTLRGSLKDGRIIVNTADKAGDVVLTLDGVDVTCLTDSAIYVAQADEVDLVLAPGSRNTVTSGTADSAYSPDSNGAAIFAEDDLDIKGEGSLEIYGYINNGITCKDDLCVKGGTVTVLAANNGLRGAESVQISGGELRVSAGNDGIKATSAAKEGKGFVEISGGSVTVESAGDAISAETELRISDGRIEVSTRGGDAVTSSKGLKAKTALTVSGGEISIHSFDHCLRSAADLTISGGSITAVSDDGKGLSAEGSLLITDGLLNISAVTEGVFSEVSLTVQGGTLLVAAGGDGLQAGSKGTGFETPVGAVSIEGGDVRVSAGEDPIDAKASLRISGGSLLAVGTSKRVKGFAADSTQPSLACSYSGARQNTVSVSADGAELMSLTAEYGFNTVLFSMPGLGAGSGVSLSNGISSTQQTLG